MEVGEGEVGVEGRGRVGGERVGGGVEERVGGGGVVDGRVGRREGGDHL